MAFLRNEAQSNLRTRIQDKLPEEYQNSMVGINRVKDMLGDCKQIQECQ